MYFKFVDVKQLSEPRIPVLPCLKLEPALPPTRISVIAGDAIARGFSFALLLRGVQIVSREVLISGHMV